ncbi:MAG: dTMP kinase [Nitrospira sp.]
MSPAIRKPSGIFITLEGGEGSGKTTQARRLCDWLTTQGRKVLHTREPGGTLLAERLRSLLLDHSVETIAPETEVWLILAARRQHVDHVIKPALQQGMIVVCDRFSDSTIAYQGYGRGLDLRVLRRMNHWATGRLVPHLTLLFDVPVRIGLTRRRSQRASQNRLDRETTRFHEKVRAGFRVLARQEPRRMVVFDASLPLESVQQSVATLITRWLSRRRIPRARQP